MGNLKIEFFHDVICSFCYPMSYMMRKLDGEFKNIEVIHRSFALVPKEESFNISFGSRKKAKEEILTHWQHANELDELKRFNIEGMRQEDFPFPSSMIPLKASKAAFLVGGQSMYWDMFDGLQKGLFSDNRNIQDLEVVYDIARSIDNMDFEQWKKHFDSQEVIDAVDEDLKLVSAYGVNSAPTLIINQKYFLGGAAPYENLKNTILKTMEEEGIKPIYK